MENTNFISTGFASVDSLIGGFRPAELTIIVGKFTWDNTLLMASMAAKIALRNEPVIIFPGHGMAEELMQYFPCQTVLKLKDCYIDDTRSLNISDFYDKCCKLKHEHNVKIVFVEVLRFLSIEHHDNPRYPFFRNCLMPDDLKAEIIVKGLKSIAKKLDISIVAMHELSYRTEGKEPAIRLNEEIPDIFSAADKILFNNRPERHGVEVDENGRSLKNRLEIVAAKTSVPNVDKTMLRIRYRVNKKHLEKPYLKRTEISLPYDRFYGWQEIEDITDNELSDKNGKSTMKKEPVVMLTAADFRGMLTRHPKSKISKIKVAGDNMDMLAAKVRKEMPRVVLPLEYILTVETKDICSVKFRDIVRMIEAVTDAPDVKVLNENINGAWGIVENQNATEKFSIAVYAVGMSTTDMTGN